LLWFVNRADKGMDTFGKRLKASRVTLGYSQAAFAEAGGVSRATQHVYESDVRVPDVEYMTKLHAIGVDILFVMTGQPRIPDAVSMAVAKKAYLGVERFVEEQRDTASSPQDRLRWFELLCSGFTTPEPLNGTE
jgi:transcriptional regulator with XRE-family HTH domain